ncbi:Hypothetical predicted protein [Lecanosticta acicola]|uniref:M protein, serotype 2.1 n=1 Tax=Lecanosticta acicola TaxID=111012 RepID=A0AAI8Z3D1_9PEZI|nr:Hypothetical predicted protein [Lecanosticta acicola]
MSTSTPNKRPAATATGPGRRTPTTNSTITNTSSTASAGAHHPSPSRMPSSQASSASAATNGVNRTRSVRNGAPVSARAAAAARKQSSAGTPDPAEEDAKAEMQAKLEELQQKLQQAELSYEESQKQAAVLQVKLDEARKEQGMLEEHVHEHTERINDLENEKRESVRARREMEQIYESERAAAMKEKEEAVAREEEMQLAMQRMKETLAQREMRAGLDDERRPMLSRHSSHGRSTNPSPNPETSDRQFAPPSVQRSDSSSRSNSKLVNQKDKIIESLRLELAEAQIKLVEVENRGGGHMQELQKQLYDIKMNNARLMEENESFQLLLSEKTLNGDFLRPPSTNISRPRSRSPDAGDASHTGGASLADELESHDESEGDDDYRRLRAEVNSLKDQNKALTLYINNIISRLLQYDQFEQILDKTPELMAGPPNPASRRYQESDTDKELPPPPPEKDEQPAGLLQRAKSVLGGKPKPRPMSQQINPEQVEKPLPTPRLDEPSRHEDPQTAPSVPLGRANSKRGGHRRANSEWPAASVVTSMYRGPQTSLGGPLSPGLTSPTNRNSFFAGRVPSSGSNVPTISEFAADKENSGPQRDSKISATSNRNSMSASPANLSGPAGLDGAPDGVVSGIATERSNPSSPPRSTTSNDKDKASGAIMMGSKPRPLRLVQEAAEEDQARKQSNRGSWFGFMNKGAGAGVFGQRSNSGEPPGSAQ